MEIEELSQVELFCLRKQVDEAAARGQDLLTEIAAQLDARIEGARTRLQELSKVGARQ